MSYYDTSKLPEDRVIIFNTPPEEYEPDLRVLSLGAGVQSTALFYMMIEGAFPRADRAIFADTQQEPDEIYDHLEKLEEVGRREGLPVDVVTAGDLLEYVEEGIEEEDGFVPIPFYIRNKNGKIGMLRRQCTRQFKIAPIYKHIRKLLGLAPYQRHRMIVEQSFGITTDEIERTRSPLKKWIVHNYPLITRRMSRGDCKRWMRERGYEVPKKSACIFCPYRRDDQWRALLADDEKLFERLVKIEEGLQKGVSRAGRDPVYIHASGRPMSERPFEDEQETPLFADGFQNECEGMCGV